MLFRSVLPGGEHDAQRVPLLTFAVRREDAAAAVGLGCASGSLVARRESPEVRLTVHHDGPQFFSPPRHPMPHLIESSSQGLVCERLLSPYLPPRRGDHATVRPLLAAIGAVDVRVAGIRGGSGKDSRSKNRLQTAGVDPSRPNLLCCIHARWLREAIFCMCHPCGERASFAVNRAVR